MLTGVKLGRGTGTAHTECKDQSHSGNVQIEKERFVLSQQLEEVGLKGPMFSKIQFTDVY